MPKRGHDYNLEFIANKLRKLEKEVKRSRREKRNSLQISSSSSTTSQSDSCSSRESSPILLENENCQETIQTPDLRDAETIDASHQADALETQIIPIDSSDSVAADPVSVGAPTENYTTEDTPDILDVLGADPSVTVEYGPEINKDVATRLSFIATSGLNKDMRKELYKKYPIPGNCTVIAAPQLNAEIKAALSDPVLKRDKAIECRQKHIATGISLLGKIISEQLGAKEKDNHLIKDLMDVGRILCDIQHSESEARRNFALYSVKKDLKDHLSTTKIDKYLFGNNLTETLKTAKAVSKSSSDLKPEPARRARAPAPSTSSAKTLNWKARTPARRQPPGPPPRLQQPAAASAPPRGTSSQAYTPRPKQTRRR